MEWAVNLINPEWTHLSHSMFFMLFCTSAKKTLLPKRWFVNWDPSIVLKPWVMLWQTNMQFSIGCLLCGLLHHGLAVWRKEMQDVPTCIETCLLCHQKLVNRSAIVCKFCLFALKFPTAMFHESNCLCMSQIRNSQEIELRCILIKIDRANKKSTTRFGQFAALLAELHMTSLLQKTQMTQMTASFHQDCQHCSMLAPGELSGMPRSTELHRKVQKGFQLVTQTAFLTNSCLRRENHHRDFGRITGKIVHLSAFLCNVLKEKTVCKDEVHIQHFSVTFF